MLGGGEFLGAWRSPAPSSLYVKEGHAARCALAWEQCLQLPAPGRALEGDTVSPSHRYAARRGTLLRQIKKKLFKKEKNKMSNAAQSQ